MIDILDKITELRKKRGWTEYNLAANSGITQSTISSWYRKNMIPSITSLEKICKAFDISLSEFFAEDMQEERILTKEQIEILDFYGVLTVEQKKHLYDFLKSIANNQ